MPPMEIVFTTKGVAKLNATMIEIGKRFDKLDAKFAAGSKLTQGAKDVVIAAVYLERAAGKVMAAAKVLRAATGGQSINKALNPPKPKTPPKMKSFGQKLMHMIGTSRVSFGKGGSPQVMPLVNKLTGLLPPEIQGIAMAGIAAGTALYQMAHQAEDAALKFAKLSFEFGSDGKMTGFLKGIGAASGLDGAGVAGVAQNLQSRITSDPTAAGLAAGMGVQNVGGFYGNQDYGAQLKAVIDGLRSLSDPSERLRVARALGVEALMPSTYTSQKQYDKHSADGALKSKILSPEFEQKAADMADAFGRLADAGENVIAALGKPFIKDMTDWFNNLADDLNGLASWFNEHQQMIKSIGDGFQWIQNHLNPFGIIKNAAEGIGKAFGGGDNPQDRANAALNDHADAVRELNHTMQRTNQLLPGTYGHSARLGDALPLNERFLGNALAKGGIQLNPF